MRHPLHARICLMPDRVGLSGEPGNRPHAQAGVDPSSAATTRPGRHSALHVAMDCSLHDVPVDGCGVGRLHTVPAEPVPADVAAQRCRGGWEVQQRQVGTYPIVFVQPGSMGMACLAGCAAARKASWLWVGHRPDPAQQTWVDSHQLWLPHTNAVYGHLTPMQLVHSQ